MGDKHNFSKSYEERKEAMLGALRREDAVKEASRSHLTSRMPLKILVSVAILSVLTISAYAAARWIDFRVEQDGDEAHVHASLNENSKDTAVDNGEKPLRSWNPDEGEISVRLNIPDLPRDMSEDKTANGKYHSEDSSRAMTINGIDLRRSDLNQLIGGVTGITELDAGGKDMYVIAAGNETAFFNRIAYIVYEGEELVLKLWVSYGITDDELLSLASTLTLEETTDALLAIPIMNEMNGGADIDIPLVYTKEEAPIYEADLLGIGESARDANDWYTAAVNSVDIYDNINVLDPSCILRGDFVERFTDENGSLIPYNRTEVIWTEEEAGKHTKHFGETVSVTKKLYVVMLTMADVTMDEMDAADRESMLRACVNSFDLRAYTVENGEVKMISVDAVVDRKPEVRAESSEIIYREYLGGNQWKVAYLIDEDTAEGNLMLDQYTGKIYVKIQ